MANKRPLVETLNIEKGENSRMTLFNLDMVMLPKIDLKDYEQVAERCKVYFERCITDDIRPTVAGMCLALNLDRHVLLDIIRGQKNDFPPEVVQILAKFHQMVGSQMEDYMTNNKINPVAGIFLMRNNHGYTNEDTIVVKTEQQALPKAEDLIAQAKLLEDFDDDNTQNGS